MPVAGLPALRHGRPRGEARRRRRAARTRLIFTDGVFSMEGDIAKLADICELARRYDAVVAVDDSHATGVHGDDGARHARSTPACWARWTSSPARSARRWAARPAGSPPRPRALCDYLTQRSRPQLFSNALPPTVAASALAAVRVPRGAPRARRRGCTRTRAGSAPRSRRRASSRWRARRRSSRSSSARRRCAIRMSDALLEEGVFVTGFGYPVVPQGQARVRCQVSAAHTREHLEMARRRVQEGRKEVGSAEVSCETPSCEWLREERWRA